MAFSIEYNPYTNIIHFLEDGRELNDGSCFLKFQYNPCIFQNCVEEIVKLINQYENISESGLQLSFDGTCEDYEILKSVVQNDNNPKSKRISIAHNKKYKSSREAIDTVRTCFEKIEAEFKEYVEKEKTSHDDELGKKVLRFMDTVKPEIPICVIGNYSVGKSAFINALIGREILPSLKNASTAKNVIVRDSKDRSIVITELYQDNFSEYLISINDNAKINVLLKSGRKNAELINYLTADLSDENRPDYVMYIILDRINSKEFNSKYTIKENVDIQVPFITSILKHDNYQYAFIDTPGSNNVEINQEAHRENLESVLRTQTNALPILLVDRSCLAGNDNLELKKLLDRFDKGFSIPNQIIVITKADELVESDLKEDLPEVIKQWNVSPTIMYVSQVMGIAEKKEEKTNWIQVAYYERYNLSHEGVERLNPPRFNRTPCNRFKVSDEKKLSPLLMASGIPQVESEIAYFAERYADYKKSANGREILLEALAVADKELEEDKKKLIADKKSQEEDRKKKKDEIKTAVENVEYTFANAVTREAKQKFDKILDEFLKSAEKKIAAEWPKMMESKDWKEKLVSYVRTLGQKELYEKNSKIIDSYIQERFRSYLTTYCENVQNCIMDHESSLSKNTRNKIKKAFDSKIGVPSFAGVEPKGFDGLKFKLTMLITKKENRAKKYFIYFEKQMRGDGKKNIGVFNVDCIQTPASAYSKQVIAWRQNKLKTLETELNSEGSILSEYDKKIRADEEKIKDLENRINNLSDVRKILVSLLDLVEV